MHKAYISGIGHYLPEKIVTNDDLSKIMDTSNEWIVERTGIEKIYTKTMDILLTWLAVEIAVKVLSEYQRAKRTTTTQTILEMGRLELMRMC